MCLGGQLAMKYLPTCLVVLFVPLSCLQAVEHVSEPADFPAFKLSVYASGLTQPDGLAFHPVSGELYVSEETAGRVSVIRQGHAVPVIEGKFQLGDTVPAEWLDEDHPSEHWLNNTLASPEGIAFGPDNSLYVVEDSTRGRVLKFTPDATGRYPAASVLPLPRLGEPYAWESLCFSRNGSLFLAGSSYEVNRGWGYSCVLACDATQQWWMVDYGPLASFSAVTLMEEDQIMVAGDESVGSLTWWDLKRQQEIQTQTHSLGTIEGICPLPDGSLAVAIEASGQGGRVVRIDPVTGRQTILAEGLGTLESVVCEKSSGRLFITEDSTGRILCLTPASPIPEDRTGLQLARRSSEARRGLPPGKTPQFLRQFMKQVGVDLVDADALNQPAGETTETRTQMTLEELGKRIPLVAGRVSVEPMPDVADPVTEVNFLSLHPNQITDLNGQPTPPICLYAAKRRSGHVDRSQTLGGIVMRKYNTHSGWEKEGEAAQLLLPLNTCSTSENSNGVTVVMTFLGLDQFEDSFLTINYGHSNHAFFATSGDRLRVARATFMEQGVDGQEICNFALTGVRTRRAEDAMWMPLKPRTTWTLISPGVNNWVSRRTMALMPDLVARMRKFDRYISDTLLVDVPGDNLPAMADQEKPDNSKASGEPARDQQHEPIPARTLTPVADLQFSTPEKEEETSFTNRILQQIVSAWSRSLGR